MESKREELRKERGIRQEELAEAGTTRIGIVLITAGACELFVRKTKEIEIEERDERNIAISNAAMAAFFFSL